MVTNTTKWVLRIAWIIVVWAGGDCFGAGNLLQNAGFETGGSSSEEAYRWEYGYPDVYGGTESSSHLRAGTWRHHSGTWEAVIPGRWGSYYATDSAYWQKVPVTPGKSYIAGAWFWADNNWSYGDQGVQIRYYNASQNLIATHTTTFWVGENWTWYEITAEAPANAAWGEIRIYVTGIGYNGSLQFDDTSFCEAPEPGEVVLTDGPTTRRTGIVFSEIMYSPSDRPDGLNLEFVELHNTEPFAVELSGWAIDGEAEYTFPESTVVEGDGYLVVAKVPSAVQSVYGLSGVLGPYDKKIANEGGVLTLKNERGAELLVVEYDADTPWPIAAAGAGHSLVLTEASYGESDPRAYSASVYRGGSPGAREPSMPVNGEPVINEILAHTDDPAVDYVELYNPGASALNLSGYRLADNPAGTNAYVIPSGVVLAARGFLSYDTNTLPFQLKSTGESLFLINSNQTRVVDAVDYPGQQNGVSFGRYPDGAPGFAPQVFNTQNSANSAFRRENVVINEIMYHPISENDADEYIELFNRGASAVNVSYWRFEKGAEFVLPPNTWIPAGGYLVIAADAANLIAKYPALNAGNTVGNFSGKLGNSGDRIVLTAPDNPNDPTDSCRYVVDDVTYCDGGADRSWADGGGSSLELMDPASDNAVDMSWRASDERMKTSNRWVTCTVTGLVAQGMLAPYTSIDRVDLFSMRGGECLIDDVYVSQGGGNLVRNSSFDSGSSYWTSRGNHSKSARSTQGSVSGAYAMYVCAGGPGDNRGNRLTGELSASLSEGNTAVLRFKARWLRGGKYIAMRLMGNYLEAVCEMDVPDQLGTPGQVNSCYTANAGPAISEVTHNPPLPAAYENVKVSARVRDPDGVASVVMWYRLDPSTSYSSVTMTQSPAGIYSATLPGQSDGTLAAYYLTATDAKSGAVKTSMYPQNPTNNECLVMFQDDQPKGAFARYTIWMRAADVSAWDNDSPLSNLLRPVTFVCGNRVIYDASIRYRGSPFVRPAYGDVSTESGAFRLEFPHDNRYLGTTEFNLDWLEPGRDSTYQRERYAYRIASAIHLPTIHQRYVEVYLAGSKHAVIYTDSQHVDSDFVESWYQDAAVDSRLHKINDWFELNYALSTDANTYSYDDATLQAFSIDGHYRNARYRWSWELQPVGEFNDDYSDLFTLIDVANLSGTDYQPALEAVCNVRQWMRAIAFRHALQDWDSFGYSRGKNMSAFKPAGGKWELIPWDIDFGLGCNWETGTDYYLFDTSDAMPIVKAMIAYPPFKRYYWQALAEIVDGPFDETDSSLDAIYAALVNQNASISSPDEVKTWVAGRRSYMKDQLYAVINTAFNITSSGNYTINSNLATIAGTSPIQDVILKVNGKPVQAAWSDETHWTLSVVLTSGVNQVTVQGCDANGTLNAGHSDTIQITCTATPALPQNSLVINEIMYNPSVNGAGFVELYNRSASTAFDLYHYRLDGVDLTFEQSTVILPGQYLVAAADTPRAIQTYGTDLRIAAQWSGSLKNDGETIALQQLNDALEVVAVIDAVKYNDGAPWPDGADGAGMSLQLIDAGEDNNRVGNWAVDEAVRSTPGAANSVAADLPAFPLVWLNEAQPVNTGTITNGYGVTAPWFELCNTSNAAFSCAGYYLTDDYTNLLKWAMPSISIGAAGFQVIWADGADSLPPEYHANFTLNQAGGHLALVHYAGGRSIIVDYMNYELIAGNSSYGCYPDGARDGRTAFFYPTPGAANNNAAAPARLYVNEWLADNKTGIINPATATREDWFEIYNAEDYAVDITGYALTDTTNKPTQWTVDGTTLLQPHECRLVWADDDDAGANQWGTNALHASFKLGKSGESLAIYDSAGSLVDLITFGAQTSDISQGRYPDGGESISALGVTTPGSANILNPNQRTIAAACSAHGQLAPTGTVSVYVGNNPSFAITAEVYYAVGEIYTNGYAIGVASNLSALTYVWSNIQADGTLYVEFAAVTTPSGTPHYWLAEYGLTNGTPSANAEADQDGDGVPTWKEYVAGTSPMDADSVFVTDMNSVSAEGPTLTWPSISNRYYTVYRSTNLLAGPVILYNRMPPTPPLNTYTDRTFNAEIGFYWIEVEE